MKKIICLSAAASLIAALAIGVSAAGEEKIVLSAPEGPYAVGETVTVTISVENFEECNTFMFYDVEYDEEYLEWIGGDWLLSDAVLSDYIRESSETDNGEQGRSGVFYSEEAPVAGNADIATMEFTVLKESETAQSIGCSVIIKNDETELSGDVEVVPVEVMLGEEPEVTGTISLYQATLELESEVFLNIYSSVTGFEGLDLTEKMGLLIWTGDESAYNEADFVYGNENVSAYPGAVKNNAYYGVQTPGIAAKELGDERYMRVYVNTGRDKYVYSQATYYGPEKYALLAMGTSGIDENLKKTMAAMLDYAAAAQIHFKYRTDDLANTKMIESYSKYRSEYAAEMLESVVAADPKLVDTWTRDKTSCPDIIASFILEGIITSNFRALFTDEINADRQTAKFMFWDQETYNNMLTTGTKFADSIPTMTCEAKFEGNRYVGGYDRLAAKELGNTLYMCVEVTTSNGIYRSGVLSFNYHLYVTMTLAGKNENNIHELVKALTVYGDSAKTYFANRT